MLTKHSDVSASFLDNFPFLLAFIQLIIIIHIQDFTRFIHSTGMAQSGVLEPVPRYNTRIFKLCKDRAPDAAQAPVKHIALVWKPARCCWHILFTS